MKLETPILAADSSEPPFQSEIPVVVRTEAHRYAERRTKVKESNLWHKFLKKIGLEKEPTVTKINIKESKIEPVA